MSLIEKLSPEMESLASNINNTESKISKLIEGFNQHIAALKNEAKDRNVTLDIKPVPLLNFPSGREQVQAAIQNAKRSLTMFKSADLSSLMMMRVLTGFETEIGFGLAQHRIISAQKNRIISAQKKGPARLIQRDGAAVAI